MQNPCEKIIFYIPEKSENVFSLKKTNFYVILYTDVYQNNCNIEIKKYNFIKFFMKVVTMFIQNLTPEYLYCALFLLMFCVILVSVLVLKSIRYNKINMQLAVLSHRFADSEALSRQYKDENGRLHAVIVSVEREYNILKASSAAKEDALMEKIAYLEQIKEDLTLKFKNISSDVIKSQHETFAAEQKNTLADIIAPFAEQLKSFKSEVVAAREESIKNKSGLDAQLSALADLNKALSKDAENLTEALKGSKKAQGNWGECQLSRVLEISGLRKGIDYETQETYHDEEKNILRPDLIVHLPENRDIIIDSKVSLVDYLAAANAENETERQKCLQKNVQSLKAHIDELAAKEYQKLLKGNALNYVIMFIPVESAYIAALEEDNLIYDYAYRRNVVLATPLSLLPTLRTVENLWRMDSQNRNVLKIAELGGKIYDKLAAFMDDMKKIENSIHQAGNAYNNALTKLTGKGGALPQAEKMRLLGAKTNKSINLPLNDEELLLNYEPESSGLGENTISDMTGEADA